MLFKLDSTLHLILNLLHQTFRTQHQKLRAIKQHRAVAQHKHMNPVLASVLPFRSFTVAKERFLNVYAKTTPLILKNCVVFHKAVQPDGVRQQLTAAMVARTYILFVCFKN